jgi:hypothetical protein
MTAEDRDQYGGPEWLDFDAAVGWLDDLGYDQLVDIEAQLQAALDGKTGGEEITLLWVIYQLKAKTRFATSLAALRVRLWLALLAAGVDLRLADFTPHAFGTAWETPPAKEKKGDPPAGTPDSSGTLTSTPADTPPSPPSTDVSTPGPGAPTP